MLAHERVAVAASAPVVRTNFGVLQAKASGGRVTVTCKAGEHAIGGGAAFHLDDGGDRIMSSRPANNDGNPPGDHATAWTATAHNGSSTNKKLIVYAICQKP